jgi:hypothetical protein
MDGYIRCAMTRNSDACPQPCDPFTATSKRSRSCSVEERAERRLALL